MTSSLICAFNKKRISLDKLVRFVVVSEKERVVNLGSLIGKLATGSGTLVSTKEDKRNKVSPG